MAIKYNVLVPIDFTPVTENALKFALDLSKTHQSSIMLLHVVEYVKEKAAAEQKLNLLIQKYGAGNNIIIDKNVVVGKVLTDIGLIADAIDVDLVVMGTHSVGLWDKIFGSNAMKVISNSDVPLILTQKGTEFSSINTIVMSLDLVKESIQIARYAAKTAKLFGSKIHLVAQKQTDEIFIHKTNANLHIVNKYLKENNLNVTVHLLDGANFEKSILNFCQEVDADLLAATYYQETFHILSSNLVQELAENPLSLPIMTLNGEETSLGTSFGFITV